MLHRIENEEKDNLMRLNAMTSFCCEDKPSGNHLNATMTVLKTRKDLTML